MVAEAEMVTDAGVPEVADPGVVLVEAAVCLGFFALDPVVAVVLADLFTTPDLLVLLAVFSSIVSSSLEDR